MKKCTKCGVSKTLSEYHKDKTHIDGLRSFCKECVTTYMKSNYVNNREKIIAKTYAWIENNRDKHNAKSNRWARLNPGKVNARTARRYAAKTQSTPKWLSQSQLLHIKCRYQIAAMLNKHGVDKWEVDHIVPIRGKDVCGLHVPWNLKIIKQSENRRKSNTFLGA